MKTYGLKLVENKIIPFKGYKVLIILNWIFVRPNTSLSQHNYTHEAVHSKQQKEITLLLFLLIYCIEYIVKVFITLNPHTAYKSISFEQEAYACEYYMYWPDTRPKYYWKHFIFSVVKR